MKCPVFIRCQPVVHTYTFILNQIIISIRWRTSAERGWSWFQRFLFPHGLVWHVLWWWVQRWTPAWEGEEGQGRHTSALCHSGGALSRCCEEAGVTEERYLWEMWGTRREKGWCSLAFNEKLILDNISITVERALIYFCHGSNLGSCLLLTLFITIWQILFCCIIFVSLSNNTHCKV